MRVLDLFAGIGGFSLGLHRAGGFETVAFAETDPYASRVLEARFPGVPNVGDVTVAEYPNADIICAGFPCQDISFAGAGAGLAGARSGLWREVVRAIRVVRPQYAILENVAALLSRGMGTVLGDLAAIGHDAEWHCIPASAVGAPHIRDRIWIVAEPQHPDADRAGSHRASKHVNGNAEPVHQQVCLSGPLGALLAHAANDRAGWRQQLAQGCEGARDVAHTDSEGPQGWDGEELSERPGERLAGSCGASDLADTKSQPKREPANEANAEPDRRDTWQEPGCGSGWIVEPNVGRVAHGIPKRVDRLRCLGNAVVPQIPELIGRAILASLNQQRKAA